MKKILLLVFLFVLGKMSYSQGYPLLQSLGSDSTIVVSKGALQSRLIPIVITDTNAANAQRLKSYPGAQLYTTAGDFYIRNSNATKWILVSSGSSGSVNIYTADGTLTGNRTLTGANNNLTFTGLNKFSVSTGDTTLFNTNTFGIKGIGGVLNVEGTAAGTTSSLTLKTASDGNWTISTGQVNFNSGDLRFYDNDNGANRMIIKPSGNVGIGTETPDSLLTVNGGVYIGGGIRAPGLPTALGTKALRINAQGQISVADTTLGGGTVTSVGTNNGSGITGGPITTSGTLAIDTTNVIATKASVSSGLAGKLNISDTASMLAPYLRAIDTASLSNRINLKLNISDTASMLGNYLNNVGYGLSKAGQVASADSATLSAYYLRRKDSLTTTNPLGYVTKKILADTAAAIRSSDAGGTVTSVATNNGTGITGGTITTSGTLAIDTTVISTRAWRQKGIDSVASLPRVTSVGLTMPVAFNVSGSPVTSAGTLAVTGAGLASQYIRGDGTLADFPGGGGGGGASVSYYLNGSVNQGTFGGNTYYEMNKTPILGGGTNFTINADGYIAQFITDAGDPGLLKIPGGNWNFELFFSASSGGGSPTYYVELYKYNGTTFTLIASGSTNPDVITGGTAVEAYFSTLPVPETVLTLTDRLAVRIYVTHAGRTITLHTEDNNLCQVITTFTTGITALNSLTAQVQYLTTGTSGTDFNISSLTDTHTFNLPTASATNRGALSTTDWTTFNNKVGGSGTINRISKFTSSGVIGNSSIADSSSTESMSIASDGDIAMGSTGANILNSKLRIRSNATSSSPLIVNNSSDNILFQLAENSSNGALVQLFDASNNNRIVLSTNAASSFTGGSLSVGTAFPDSMFQVTQGAYFQRGIRASGLPAAPGTKALRIDASGTLSYADTLIDAGGTVTSVATNNGTGITGGTITTSGTLAIDTTVISTRAWRQKGIDSVAALINSNVSGAANRVSKFTGTNTISNSSIVDEASSLTEAIRITSTNNVGIGTTSPTKKLSVQGDAIVSNDQYVDRALFLAQSGLHVGTAGYNSITANDSSFLFTTNPPAASTRQSTVTFNGSNTYRFPDSSGTVALLQNITSSISGTPNYIPKFTGSNSIGNSVIYESSSNIGIGTTSPANRFTVAGAGGAAYVRVEATDATLAAKLQARTATSAIELGAVSNNPVVFVTNDTERMRLDASGNLGLGVTPSAVDNTLKYFEVGNAGNSFAGFNGGSAIYLLSGALYNAGWKYAVTGSGVNRYDIGSGGYVWYQAPSGTAGNAISFTQAMTLNASGNLGIGTTSPSYKLQVEGAFGTNPGAYVSGTTYGTIGANRGASSASAGLNLYSVGSQKWFAGIYENSDNFGYYSVGTNSFPMVINYSTGNVGIGTTSPSDKLHVYQNADDNVVGKFEQAFSSRGDLLQFTNAHGTGYVGHAGDASGDFSILNASNTNTYFTTNGTERMRITSAGNVGIGTTSPGSKLHVMGGSSPNNTIFATTSDYSLGSTGSLLRIGHVASTGNTTAIIQNLTVGGTGTGNISFPEGNVGIGTTSPTSKLHVFNAAGPSIITNETYNGITSIWNSSDGSIVIFGSTSNHPLAFYSNNAERMRIASGGNVLVGTTTDSGAKFQVAGTMQTDNVVVGGFPAPTNYGAGKFKLSSVYSIGTNNYVKIEIDGTVYTIQLQ